MKNEIKQTQEFNNFKKVKYKNDFLTSLNLNELTAINLNLLIEVLANAKETNKNDVSINFNEIQDLLNLKNYNDYKIKQYLETNTSIFFEQWIKTSNKNQFNHIAMFQQINADIKTRTFNLIVNPIFLNYFNNFIDDNYTTYKAKEFITLKSKYTKLIYCILKQYRKSGEFITNYNDFIFNFLGISNNLKPKEINRTYIKKAVKELNDRNYFNNLTYRFTYNKNKQIVNILFTFQKELEEDKTYFKNETEKTNYYLNRLNRNNKIIQEKEENLQKIVEIQTNKIKSIDKATEEVKKADTTEEINKALDNELF